MVTNYYNASNNYSSPIRREEPKPYEKPRKEEIATQNKHPNTKLDLDKDKVLLLGILAVLYLTDCEDMWLMLALLYLALG
ncbi:MAG: hypothetical protein IJB50_02310 [Clostridia bacterium]|nr:hypothetical protein [Clostridia bacterium]